MLRRPNKSDRLRDLRGCPPHPLQLRSRVVGLNDPVVTAMSIDLDNDTSEGAQELQPRKGMKAEELLRELGCVLRMSEADAAELGARDPGDDETMIINMGPQHPSTHGVLRLMLELDGETVLRTKPIIGYLHTGMEKTGEDLTFLQGPRS